MSKPELKDDVGFAIKFTKPGVIAIPVNRQTQKPDDLLISAIDATLTLEKIRTTRRLLSHFTVALFVLTAILAILGVSLKIVLGVVLGMNAILLVMQYAFQWAQLIQCELTEAEVRHKRLKEPLPKESD